MSDVRTRTVFVHGIDELRVELARLVAERGAESVGLVPTMGALHAGHTALMEAAVAENAVVAASLFVNPLQFDRQEDFDTYPRDLTGDMEIFERGGVDLVFAPSVEEMYPGFPDAPAIGVSSGEMGRVLEGASRPGHFDGMATVVAKLFQIFMPKGADLRAYFGEKDAQQLMIVKRMVADLSIPVTVRPVKTQREPSGLALSSRNQLLSEAEKESATVLSRALLVLADRARAGEDWGLDELRALIDATDDVELDHLLVVDPTTLRPTDRVPGLALVAARVGAARLIDNMMIEGPDGD
ncbi:pantoate--beta-alanine ligase [Brevibacterium samyangense]|uniref:Pantothenate synthetase n=1 Tax=Brevibacterium samyangense TaxID=366888 RepID=A0ABN2THE3_9MICO